MRGKLKRQQSLFPDLEKAVEAEKAKTVPGVKWPDQGSKPYHDECERLVGPHVGTQLTAQQRKSFISRVIRAFAIYLGLRGLSGPQCAEPSNRLVPSLTYVSPRLVHPTWAIGAGSGFGLS